MMAVYVSWLPASFWLMLGGWILVSSVPKFGGLSFDHFFTFNNGFGLAYRKADFFNRIQPLADI